MIIKHIYVCDVNKGRQRNVEKKKRNKRFDDLVLNRALHCNQMIIHLKREHIHIRKKDIEGEIDDHENGGIKE